MKDFIVILISVLSQSVSDRSVLFRITCPEKVQFQLDAVTRPGWREALLSNKRHTREKLKNALKNEI